MQAPGSEHNTTKSQDISEETPEGLPRRFERYTLLRRIARGGMGEVYLGSSGGIEGAERPAVIKLIRRDHEEDASFLARFLDEARIQSQLQHPGVAQILEAATDSQGKPFVVVEYVEGRNLADVRARSGQLGVRIGWQEAVAVAITMGDALAHVHERTDASGKPLEIVHRDLSPQNVMVGYDGDIKLIDFGTARGENRRCHTISGIVYAKPGYVAPEVANNQPGGVPADLYAFGVMVWELCAGRRFLVGDASVHLAAVGAGRRIPTPIAQAVGAPFELDTVIGKLTATDMGQRYASAREAISELVRLLQRSPSLADGDRSVRGRIAQLMRRLYPAEPARSRAEFARLVAESRSQPTRAPLLPPSPEPPPSRLAEELLPGTRYRKLGELGRGSSAIVYRAEHLDLGRKVALKVQNEARGGAALERFRSEARAIASLEHEHLVRLYEFGVSGDGQPYYAMELVEGESLDQRLAREGAMAWRAAVALMVQAASAVDAAHRAAVVHRDIKPHNLLLSRDGVLKLADFGVAKLESEIEVSGDGEALVIVGTPEYMAPEQVNGGQADQRSDVYALGVVLFELLTASLPHQAPTTVALLEQKRRTAARKLGDAVTQPLPPALGRVVEKALSIAPEERFQSAAELRQALLDTLALRSEVSVEPPLPPRRRRAAGLVASGITFVVSLVLGAAMTSPTARTQAADALTSAGEQARLLGQKSVAKAKQLLHEPAPAAEAAVVKSPLEVKTALVAEPASEAADPDRMLVTPGEPLAAAPAAPAAADFGEDAEQAKEARAEADAQALVAQPESDDQVAKALVEVARLDANNAKIKALHLLRRTGAAHPGDTRVLKAWVAAAEESKGWGEARKVARRWAEIEPSIEAKLVLARLERATGNRERALTILSELSREAPESNEVRELVSLYGGQKRLALNH